MNLPAEVGSRLASYRSTYEHELFERVLPFWLNRSVDHRHGGYFTCLDRDGRRYDTTKYVWLQGRQAWLFSKLYRTVDARDAWLETARLGVTFLRAHAVRPDGRVYFSLAADGRPVYLQRKIFSECFYILALAEYARAADQPEWHREALDLFERVWTWSHDLTRVGRPALAGAPVMQDLSIPMILLNLIEELTGDDPALLRAFQPKVDACITRMLRHVHPNEHLVLEHVAPDGTRIDSPQGRLLNPGHAIEAGWFLHHWAERLARTDLRETASDMIRWSFHRGWDDAYGGLYYFLDAKGYSPVQLEWSMKLWWPHTEALYAHLLNFAHSGRREDLDSFEKVHAYIFSHFVDPDFPEWYGYLDRTGTVTHRFKGGPYKGCFHVPRALWLCLRLIDRMLQPGASQT